MLLQRRTWARQRKIIAGFKREEYAYVKVCHMPYVMSYVIYGVLVCSVGEISKVWDEWQWLVGKCRRWSFLQQLSGFDLLLAGKVRMLQSESLSSVSFWAEKHFEENFEKHFEEENHPPTFTKLPETCARCCDRITTKKYQQKFLKAPRNIENSAT